MEKVICTEYRCTPLIVYQPLLIVHAALFVKDEDKLLASLEGGVIFCTPCLSVCLGRV